MSTQPRSPAALSPREYLEAERAADDKSEYYDGEVVALGGASFAHNAIAANLTIALGRQLADGPCVVLPSDMRGRLSERVYVYPDISVVCDEPAFLDDGELELLNPVVVVEVLSESTEMRDRTVKAAAYRALDSVRELLLITQTRRQVEQYVRRPDGSWIFREAGDATGPVTLGLPSLGCTLSLDEIYRKVP